MKKHIDFLEIKNFKSIENLRFDCNKINVFIGEPNVGKSNILEALSLFEIYDYETGSKIKGYSTKDILRFKDPKDLFYYQNIGNRIEVLNDKDQLVIDTIHSNEKLFGELQGGKDASYIVTINSNRKIRFTNDFDYSGTILSANTELSNHYRRYDFSKKYFQINSANSYGTFLRFPFGENLLNILNIYPKLNDLISGLFESTGFEFVMNESDNSMNIQRRMTKSSVRTIPFIQIADTIQRIIFYFAAIHSNKESILIFEEPEVHSFPPYVVALAQEILSSETNQFFIATHSPYLLNEVIEKCPVEDVNIFVTYLQDYQTQVRLLTSEELSELLNYGIDIFFNLANYAESK